jgi:dipeptidyl aminopeptidase/acylaminoacyl peptidase
MRHHGLPLALLLSVILAGCAMAPQHAALRQATLPTLIPVRAFVANPKANFGYQVSPDGKKLAWVDVQGTSTAIFVRPLDQQGVTVLPVYTWGFTWAQDSQRLFFAGDSDGQENFHVFMVDTEHPQQPPVDLTPFEQTRAWVQQILRHDPAHILVAHNRRDPAVFDLYRVSLLTHTHTLIAQNPGDVVAWITDEQGNLRARLRKVATMHQLDVLLREQQTWRTIATWPLEESVTITGFTADDAGFWVLSNRGRDRVGVARMALDTGEETLIYTAPTVDVEGLVISPLTYEPMLALSYPDYQHLHVFDADLAADVAVLRPPEPAHVAFLSMDTQARRLTVAISTYRGTEFYLFNRESRHKTLLGKSAITAYAGALVPMRPITVPSRDGLPLHGYLTLPQGTPDTPLPFVLLVHGGPWERDYWGYNRLSQFLANRGYAVLQINFRGSTGYGRAFAEAAIGEFAGKMHIDLLDGVHWAIEHGIADTQKIAIMGGSYGGYAALVGLSFTPEVFACGVDIAGVTNLATFVESTPVYWKHWVDKWYRYVGDPSRPADRQRMEAQSPLFRAEQIRRPLLIVHGDKDSRVKPEQSTQLVTILKQAGREVEYVQLAGEGHIIFHWRNQLALYRQVEDFLATCLGGRSRGFDLFQLYQVRPR